MERMRKRERERFEKEEKGMKIKGKRNKVAKVALLKSEHNRQRDDWQ